jgi:hypothetical protein
MKSIQELTESTAAGRKTTLVSAAKAGRSAPIVIAKVLFVAGLKGDFEDGGMNNYSQKVTGMDLRRELQGTYERVNLLTAMHKKEIDMTEEEFDTCLNFAAIKLASLVKKGDAGKIAEAMAIIRSGEDVTKRIKDLCSPPKEKKSDDAPAEKEGAETPELQAGDSDVFVIPRGIFVTDHSPLMERLVGEIAGAQAEDLTVLSNVFALIAQKIHERHNELAAAAKPAKGKVAEADKLAA